MQGGGNLHSVVCIVYGVSGCGKSAVTKALGSRYKCVRVLDADDFHSEESKKKMSSGIPLTEKEREPWLKAVGDGAADAARSGVVVALACSALSSQARKLLRKELASGPHTESENDKITILYVHLDAPKHIIHERLMKRDDHFFDPGLLDSQIETLSSDKEPNTFTLDVSPRNPKGNSPEHAAESVWEFITANVGTMCSVKQ